MTPTTPLTDLTQRLRGVYTVPVNDGFGLLDGKDTYTRNFDVEEVLVEAAVAIETLEKGQELDTGDLILRLSEPRDPLNIGKLYVSPISLEAIRAIAELQIKMGNP